MSRRSSLANFLRIYVIGLSMGTADGVPGVSGGTIALIAGIYTRLIEAITAITLESGYRLFAGLLAGECEAVREVLEETDAAFLLSLGSGILTAVVIVTRIVGYADQHHPIALFGFFFGLIAASVVVLARQITLSRPRHLVVAGAGFLLAFLLSGDVTLLEGNGPAIVFMAGAVAVSAMILPGISGSLILIILGQYVFLSERLAAFTDGVGALIAEGTVASLATPGATIAIFLVGAVVGLFTVARLVDHALHYAPNATLIFLVSLVVGALRAPVTEISSKGIGWTAETTMGFTLAAFSGAVVLYGLDYFAIDVEIHPEVAEGSQG